MYREKKNSNYASRQKDLKIKDRSKSSRAFKPLRDTRPEQPLTDMALRPVSPHIISTPDLTPQAQDKTKSRTRNPNTVKSRDR